MTRCLASLCSLLLVALCGIGAAPASHGAPSAPVARGATELALRDVSDSPLLAPRAVAARISSARLAEGGAPAVHFSASAVHAVPRLWTASSDTRATLRHRDVAHRGRPRWRTHDAAAPPARSRLAH
jgi:hypothetical protein